jgi:hypothetical protein
MEVGMYNIMARVSGGMTGLREAICKKNGEIMCFQTREEAQKKAHQLTHDMNHPFATAKFDYWVIDRPVTGG